MDLFNKEIKEKTAPLADRMRPASLKDFVGQNKIAGPGTMLAQSISSGKIPSMILWGPPGSGKTTLAKIISKEIKCDFTTFSAVLSGVKEVRMVIEKAKNNLFSKGEKTILFVDEIHRFNKSQQDSFLPHVESGVVTLIGATTENPSFEVNAALLSRCQVVVLDPLNKEGLGLILDRTLDDSESGFGKINLKIEDRGRKFLIDSAHGDARALLNCFEIAAGRALERKSDSPKITLYDVEQALQSKALLYDKKGEEHYNVISAFIKSMRGSDPDAAVYYLARMIDAGEDPLFIARRMVILASEDIANADPGALNLAVSTMRAVHMIGLPEGRIHLAHCACYLACAPKSNKTYSALNKALADVKKHGPLPVPKHIRNAPTNLMKEMGYSKGYKYDHNFDQGYSGQAFLPDELKGKRYYKPSENGIEKRIKERLTWLRSQKKKG